MSEETKDVELKKLSKDSLRQQISVAEKYITQAEQEITKLQIQIQQQLGVAGFAKHLLEKFELPEKIEEPKKAPLEVQ